MSEPVRVAEDRTMRVGRGEVVRTAWVEIDRCRLGNRTPMSPEAVEAKFRRLLNVGPDAAPWPPPVGRWEGDRFTVFDGRHQLLASLMLGHTHLFVAWVEPAEAA